MVRLAVERHNVVRKQTSETAVTFYQKVRHASLTHARHAENPNAKSANICRTITHHVTWYMDISPLVHHDARVTSPALSIYNHCVGLLMFQQIFALLAPPTPHHAVFDDAAGPRHFRGLSGLRSAGRARTVRRTVTPVRGETAGSNCVATWTATFHL